MSDLKEQLIRLGYEQPDLRKHLSPILDKIGSNPISEGILTTRERPPSGWEGYSVSKTYSKVTQESAQYGEVADRGYSFQDRNYTSLEEIVKHHGREHTWEGRAQISDDFRIRSEGTMKMDGSSTTHTLFIKRADGRPLHKKEKDYLISKFE